MLKRVVVTAPRAFSTSVRPAINSQARIAAPVPASASRTSKRCYHEKDKLQVLIYIQPLYTARLPYKLTTTRIPRLYLPTLS